MIQVSRRFNNILGYRQSKGNMDLTLIHSFHVSVRSNHGISRYEDTFAVRQERKHFVSHARQVESYIQGKTKRPPDRHA